MRAAEDTLEKFLQTNRQLENSPQLSFQRDRLQREAGRQQQMMLGLVQQYEDARIREVRDTPVITVIERPVLAASADSRQLPMAMATTVPLALLVVVSLILARESHWDSTCASGISSPKSLG